MPAPRRLRCSVIGTPSSAPLRHPEAAAPAALEGCTAVLVPRLIRLASLASPHWPRFTGLAFLASPRWPRASGAGRRPSRRADGAPLRGTEPDGSRSPAPPRRSGRAPFGSPPRFLHGAAGRPRPALHRLHGGGPGLVVGASAPPSRCSRPQRGSTSRRTRPDQPPGDRLAKSRGQPWNCVPRRPLQNPHACGQAADNTSEFSPARRHGLKSYDRKCFT